MCRHRPLETFNLGKWHGRPARESRARCACHIQTASLPIWKNRLTTVHFYYNYEALLFVYVTYEHTRANIRPDYLACEATHRDVKFTLRGLFEERENRMPNRVMR